MTKILIVDASPSYSRLMSSLLTRAGYESVLLEQRKRQGINKKGQVES